MKNPIKKAYGKFKRFSTTGKILTIAGIIGATGVGYYLYKKYKR